MGNDCDILIYADNSGGRATSAAIGGPPDLIVISDCVYYESSLAPLIFTLRELASAKLHKEAQQEEENSKAGHSLNESSQQSTIAPPPVLLSYEIRDYSPAKKKGNTVNSN